MTFLAAIEHPGDFLLCFVFQNFELPAEYTLDVKANIPSWGSS